jgi:hypothetical protein
MCHTFFKPDFSERRNVELLVVHYLKTNPNPIPCQGPQTWRAFFLAPFKRTKDYESRCVARQRYICNLTNLLFKSSQRDERKLRREQL